MGEGGQDTLSIWLFGREKSDTQIYSSLSGIVNGFSEARSQREPCCSCRQNQHTLLSNDIKGINQGTSPPESNE